MPFLLSQYLALSIFNLKTQFCVRNSSDILYMYPCLDLAGQVPGHLAALALGAGRGLICGGEGGH